MRDEARKAASSVTDAAGHMKRLSAQAKRFIEAAREHGASEDERVFDEELRRIAKAGPAGSKKKGDA